MRTPVRAQSGFALVSVLLLMALLMAIALAHFSLTSNHLSTARSSMSSTQGLYAAEAGLNLRANAVRLTFENFAQPTGTSPNDSTMTACSGSNLGSGDYRCISYGLLDRSIATYMKQPPGSPLGTVIPRGEPYQNRDATEYRYQTFSVATNSRGSQEAILELDFKSRLVPLFQFFAFYGKDLEILTPTATTINGPVHANGDLYLGPDATLALTGQVTSAGTVFRGKKDANTCPLGAVSEMNPSSAANLPTCSTTRRAYTRADLVPWNGMVVGNLSALTTAGPEELNPVAGSTYWDHADLRIVLNMNGGTPAIEVRSQDGSMENAHSVALNNCTGTVATSNSLYNNREAKSIRMLDVDMQKLCDCIHTHNVIDHSIDLDDTTDGGFILYLGVDGPGADAVNGYGIRLKNGASLASTAVGAPALAALTIATNQAMYVKGDFNTVTKKQVAILADSMNVLSNAWSDANSSLALTSRIASATTVNAALFAGTDTTGGAEGSAGRDHGGYTGGLQNFWRFHERWTGVTFTFFGSLVSLTNPTKVNGAFVQGSPQFDPPTLAWSYDDTFDDVTLLPPIPPQFVYLKQELFVRKF